MWLGAEKGAMDYVLQLNNATGGLVGMGIVAGSVAGGPLIDTVSGLGQMATGMQAIKNLGMIQWLSQLGIMTKLSAAANWLLSGAQAVLNAIMAMNPIILVVIALIALAAALIWAYQNVDWFRAMVDNAWQSIVTFGQQLYSFISGALQGLVNAITAVGAWLVGRVQASFSAIWSIISAAMNLWNQATAKARSIANMIGNAFNGVKGLVQGAFNGVTHAITAPFESAYNTLKPIIDNIKAAWDMLMGIGGSAGITTGSAGISMGSVNGIGSANSNLISNINNATGSPNIVLNGIIEESAGDFIVRKLSDEIYKQNVLRGVE
jgi:phage-related protein